MENKDPNPFPEIRIISVPERLCRVGRWLNHLVSGPHILSPVSEHFQKDTNRGENTGSGPMLDRELYGQLHETHDGVETWTEMGKPIPYPDGVVVRECPDVGDKAMMIGPNQMVDNSEEAGQ